MQLHPRRPDFLEMQPPGVGCGGYACEVAIHLLHLAQDTVDERELAACSQMELVLHAWHGEQEDVAETLSRQHGVKASPQPHLVGTTVPDIDIDVKVVLRGSPVLATWHGTGT